MRAKSVALLLAVIIVCLPLTVLTGLVSAAEGRTFYSTNRDGDINSWGDTYASAHDLHDLSTAAYNSEDNVTTYWNAQNYLRTELSFATFTVGQEFDDPQYKIWRGLLTFDTSSLPTSITPTGVSIFMVPTTNGATGDEFDIKLKPAGDIHYPAIPSDFDTIGAVPDIDYCTVNSVDMDALEWEEFAFDAGGMAIFMGGAGGLTQIAVVSDEDVGNSAPTGDEYIKFFSHESQFRPYMVVTYTVKSIGQPDYLGLHGVAIFTDYVETGDQLILFSTMVEYESDYVFDKLAEEYFYAQVRYDGGEAVGQVSIRRWNYGLSGIYLNPDIAVDPDEDILLRIEGWEDKFLVAIDNFDYAVQSKDWKGASGPLLDKWILSEVEDIGELESTDSMKYRLDILDGTVLNDAGSQLVLEAMPNMDQVRPALFVGGYVVPDEETHTPAENSMVTKWGAYWGGALNDIGDSVGLGGAWVAGLGLLALSGAAMMLVRRATNEPTLGIMAALPILGIGFLFGFPIIAVVLGAVLVTFLFFYTFWARST